MSIRKGEIEQFSLTIKLFLVDETHSSSTKKKKKIGKKNMLIANVTSKFNKDGFSFLQSPPTWMGAGHRQVM